MTEIPSAVSELAHRQQSIGVGVVLGSNVFNLAALLTLGAFVAGHIALHRRVVALEGVIATWQASVSLMAVLHVISPALGLALALAVLVPYAVLAGLNSTNLRTRLGGSRLHRWLDRHRRGGTRARRSPGPSPWSTC